LYRLKEESVTNVDSSEVSFSYQYDAVGNRVYSIEDGVHTKYTYDSNDRLQKQGGVTYSYDDNGNTVQITEEGDVTKLSYDGDNRLIGVVTEENGQVTSTVSYAYDADGNRVQTVADGQLTQYVVDSNDTLAQVVTELDSNNQVQVAYLYGDDLVSQYRGNDVSYYHYDGLGSTRTLTDSTATVTNTYIYEAFGGLTEQTGETENNYLFTGEQIDPNTGNYYLRNRFYSPDNGGRFLSMDSFDGLSQEPVTLHKYLYGNGDPVNMVDPTGYFSLGSFSASSTIRGILTTMDRIDTGLNILDAVFNEDSEEAPSIMPTKKGFGMSILLGMAGKAGSKLLHLFTKKAKKLGKKRRLYRGVNQHNIAFDDAKKGIVKGSYFAPTAFFKSTREKHNTGYNGTHNSPFSSWTPQMPIARNFALRNQPPGKKGRGFGVVIIAKIRTFRIFKSPDRKAIATIEGRQFSREYEFLVVGPVIGIPIFVK